MVCPHRRRQLAIGGVICDSLLGLTHRSALSIWIERHLERLRLPLCVEHYVSAVVIHLKLRTGLVACQCGCESLICPAIEIVASLRRSGQGHAICVADVRQPFNRRSAILVERYAVAQIARMQKDVRSLVVCHIVCTIIGEGAVSGAVVGPYAIGGCSSNIGSSCQWGVRRNPPSFDDNTIHGHLRPEDDGLSIRLQFGVFWGVVVDCNAIIGFIRQLPRLAKVWISEIHLRARPVHRVPKHGYHRQDCCHHQKKLLFHVISSLKGFLRRVLYQNSFVGASTPRRWGCVGGAMEIKKTPGLKSGSLFFRCSPVQNQLNRQQPSCVDL